MSQRINYKNIEYSSMKELFKSHAAEGVTYAAFMSRIKNGFTLDEALTAKKKNNVTRKYFVDNREFSNLKELAKEAGISYEAAVKRSHRGWTDNEIFFGKQKNNKNKIKEKKQRGAEVTISGVVYKNLKHAFDVLKPSCSFNTLKARLRYKFTLEEAFETVHKTDGRKQTSAVRRFDIDGEILNIKEVSEKYQTSYSTIIDRLNRGASIRQAVGLDVITNGELRKQVEVYKVRNNRIKKEYVVDGVTYYSVAQLARAYGLPSSLVYNRMRESHWSAERAVKEDISEKVSVNGKEYRSGMSAWESIGITNYDTFLARKAQGYSIEVCLGLLPLPSKERYEIGDKVYSSISEVAKAYNLSTSQLNSRLNNMSLEEAVIYKPANGRYTAASFEKNLELANTQGVLYFIRIKLSDGMLHKVGITQKDTSKRFKSYEYELIHEVKGSLKGLYELEQLIVNEYEDLHYRAEKEFDGRTETFLLMPDEELNILEFILQNSKSI